MSSRGGGEDSDQEQERQGDHSSHSGAHESATDITLQFQRQGAQVETIATTESQTTHDYGLPVGQVPGFASTHTQTEADHPISSPTNADQEDHFSQSSASDLDEPTTVESNPTVAVPTEAPSVKQEDQPPVAVIQPQPAYDLSDIYGHGILTHGPIPPPRQVAVRGRGVARAQISVRHIGNALRMILGQSDARFMGFARQIFTQDPPENPPDGLRRELTSPMVVVMAPCGSWTVEQIPAPVESPVPVETAAGAQQQEAAQPAGPSQQCTRPPSADNSQQTVDAEQSAASTPTPPEAEIRLTPATVADTMQHYEPDTDNPVQQQESGLAVLQDSNPPTEHDINLEQAGDNCGSPQPSSSGEDMNDATICPECKGVLEQHSTNEESEIMLDEQVSVLHPSHQIAHASTSTSDVLPVSLPPANPVQQQESGLAVPQDSNEPTERDIDLQQKGGNCGSPQLSTSFSEEDVNDATICPVCKAVLVEHSPNEESEIMLDEQVSVLHPTCQMAHASASTSDVLPVALPPETDLPLTTVAGRHGANYPTGVTLPPQQVKGVETEGSGSQFANATGTFTQDKSTQVNIGLEQQEDGPDRNPNNAQGANIGSYDDPGTSSQMPSTLGDAHEVTRRENSRERLMAQAVKIFKRNVPDPKLRSVLAPVTKLLFSDWTPRDDAEARQLERSLKCVEYLMTKETGHTSRRHAKRSEDGGEARAAGRADTRGGDRPVGRHPLMRGRQDSPQPGQNSGVARCTAAEGSGPAAVSHHQIATGGGRKRHSDPKAVASPAAKRKRVVCHLETEVQCTTTEGEDGAHGEYVTAITGEQQMAEKQENDSPHDVHYTDEEVCVIHEHTRGDGEVRILIKHELAMDRHCAPAVGPSTLDATATVETQQLHIRHSTRGGRELKVLSQYAEVTNTCSVQPSRSAGNRREVLAAAGNIPSSGGPGTSMMPISDGQEDITKQNCAVCRHIKQEGVDSEDSDVEVSNNPNEETENEHEPAGIEDICRCEMVSSDAEDRNEGNDRDLNVPAENKSDQRNDAASVEKYYVPELKEENERNSPTEGMAHNSDDDDVIFLYGSDTYTL